MINDSIKPCQIFKISLKISLFFISPPITEPHLETLLLHFMEGTS
jgi:hypothetical protein